MKLPISDRLLACAAFIHPGDRVADIGCDHGYLSIHLLAKGIADSVIASDVREQPLQSAMRNAARFGVADKMSFYLSDGVRNIPRDFDTMVCAGMGGDTMVHILQSAPWLRKEQYRLILQCQSKAALLRRYLSENGWFISKETVLRDGKFLYTVMEVIWKPEQSGLTTGQWYISPAMLEHATPETAEHFRYILNGIAIKVAGHGESADPELKTALEELRELAEKAEYSWLKEERV